MKARKLLMRIISIESDRQRLGLSLTEVTSAEKAQWDERQLELVAAAAEAAQLEAEQAEADEQAALDDTAELEPEYGSSRQATRLSLFLDRELYCILQNSVGSRLGDVRLLAEKVVS